MIFKRILLIVVCGCLLFFVGWFIYGLIKFIFITPVSAMYVPSFDKHIRLMKEHLHIVKGKKIVDLGCGDGKALRFFSKTYNLVGDGYELQGFPYRYGKLLNHLFGYTTITLSNKNFMLADLKRYDYIYVYLLPQQLAHIESWIFKNITDDAIIVSNSFQFALHQPFQIIKDKKGRASIFLYRKN